MSLAQRIRSLLQALIPPAQAHCDTADGPAVVDGRRALDSGNLDYALKWIRADGERELADVFAKARQVRRLGPLAAEMADRLFLETLVRLHRMAEGVGFTGILPSGTKLDPIVVAADRALETGDDSELIALAPDHRREELHRRFLIAFGKKTFDVDDVDAGRDYVASYVSYFKFAEGEEHAHGHEGHHGAGHAAAAQAPAPHQPHH